MPWNGCPQYQLTMTLVGAVAGEVEALAVGDGLADEIRAAGFVHHLAVVSHAPAGVSRLCRAHRWRRVDWSHEHPLRRRRVRQARAGRAAALAPGLREENAVDFVIANGENAANGAGITSKIAERLLAGGVDVHHHRQPRVAPEGGLHLSGDGRPHRAAGQLPDRGAGPRPHRAARRADGAEVAVINLAGELFLNTGMSPFRIVDRLVDEAAATGRDDRRRPARRGDQREGRHGPLPGRPRDRRAGHAHARADVATRACSPAAPPT